MKHGTPGGYTNHRCRCDECRTAWREYRRGYGRGAQRARYEAARRYAAEHPKQWDQLLYKHTSKARAESDGAA